jgi:hypothetical protein
VCDVREDAARELGARAGAAVYTDFLLDPAPRLLGRG